eukprot:gene9137-10716_t
MAGVSRGLTRALASVSRGGIAGSFSGMGEEIAGYPLDLEGVVGMFRGMSSPLMAAAMISTVQFGTFESANQWLEKQNKSLPETVRLLASGGAAGLMQSFIICPVDVIKSRMMVQGAGHGHGHGGGSNIAMSKTIYSESGAKGFYRGMGATLLRDVPGMALFFTTYESLKKTFGIDGHGHGGGASFLSILAAGGLAGAAYHGSTHFFDIAKTLIQTQTTGPKYKGTYDCLKQLVQREGVRGLFKGYWPSVIRSVPSNAAGFGIYELIQNI